MMYRGIKHVPMRLIVVSTVLAVVAANPLQQITIYDDIIYNANHTCYTAEYDVVSVHVPQNSDELLIYFVQANTTNNVPIYKGLYVVQMNTENPKCRPVIVRKLLDHGTCITSDEHAVYFGSTDGIYKYTNETVEKFGSVSANIRDIQKVKSEDIIYIVTEDNKLYTVTETGNRMVEHDTINNVQQIALDSGNNLYFYEKHEDPERYLMFHERYLKPKVLVGDRVVEISGLPDTYTHIRLANLMGDTIVLLGNYFYKLSSNGTSSDLRLGFVNIPTAFSLDLGLIQIFSSENRMYCYSPLERLGEGLSEGLGKVMTALAEMVAHVFEALDPANLINDLKHT